MKDTIFGLQPLREAFAAGRPIEKVLLRMGSNNPAFKELKAELTARGVPFQQVPIEKLDYLCPARTHQGVIALIAAAPFVSLADLIANLYEEGKTPLILALDGVTDVRNFGALVRTAESMGVHAVLVGAKGGARLGGDAVKTSSGALLHLPVCREPTVEQGVEFLKQCGLKIVGCTEKAWKPAHLVDFTEPVCLVMGDEFSGVSPQVLRLCDENAAIFTRGKVASLNVSVAFGMIMYEIYHQRAAVESE